jgi:hypothetical protein
MRALDGVHDVLVMVPQGSAASVEAVELPLRILSESQITE